MKVITKKIIKRFEQYLYEEEKSDNTIEKYMRDIRFFHEWFGDKELDKSVVLAYKKELCKKYMPASVNSILSSLNALFKFPTMNKNEDERAARLSEFQKENVLDILNEEEQNMISTKTTHLYNTAEYKRQMEEADKVIRRGISQVIHLLWW